MIYATYLGGKGGDALLAIAMDSQSGNIFVAGKTEDANVMPGSRTDAMFAILSPTGTLIRKARTGNTETSEWAISASVSPDGHYFSGLYLSNEILELSPEILEPIRRANLRTGTAPAIFALPGGLVEVAAPGGALKTNIFLVPAGKPTIGALYLAQYDFRRAAPPGVTAIVNAASYMQGRQFGGGAISLAGNEIFTIFGEQLQLPVQVTLAGHELAILYAGETQINTLVPNDVPLGSSEIVIESAGTVLGRYPVEIARAVPALFVHGGAAPVSAAAINQDGTINSREHPAPPGSVVALFGTGLGRTTSDGFLAEHLEAYGPGGPGGGMEILYAGVAPGLAGVQQVNARVHSSTPVGASPYVALLRVVFGSAATFERTQDNVGIWVGAP